MNDIFNRVLFLESKERLINSNKFLTSEQKTELLDFFYGNPNDPSKKPHANLDSKIDWQNPKTVYQQFVDQFKSNTVAGRISSSKYKEGEDYYDYGESGGLHYYVPLSREVQRDVFQKDCPTRWCIGSINSDGTEWRNYTTEDKSNFMVIFNSNDCICLQYYWSKDIICIWNSRDMSYQFDRQSMINDIKAGVFNLGDSKDILQTNLVEDDIKRINSDQRNFADYLDADILSKFVVNFKSISDEISKRLPEIKVPTLDEFLNFFENVKPDSTWSIDREKGFIKRMITDTKKISDAFLYSSSDGIMDFVSNNNKDFDNFELVKMLDSKKYIKTSLIYRFIYNGEEITPITVRVSLVLRTSKTEKETIVMENKRLSTKDVLSISDMEDLASNIIDYATF